jgi:hypothetical protein
MASLVKGGKAWRSNDWRSESLRASSGLLWAIGQIVGSLEGVQEIRVLHRDRNPSKFFVIMQMASLVCVERVVDVMVQLEDKFTDDRFDYDTVPADAAALVPSDAAALTHG